MSTNNKVFLVAVQMPDAKDDAFTEDALMNDVTFELEVQERIEKALSAMGMEHHILTEDEVSIPAKDIIECRGKETLLNAISVIRKHRDELMKTVATRQVATAIGEVMPLLESLLTTEAPAEVDNSSVPEAETEYYGVVRWVEQDVIDKLKENGIEPTPERVADILNEMLKDEFEEVQIAEGWNYIENAIAAAGFDADLPDDMEVCPVCRAAINPNDGEDNGYGELRLYWKCRECGSSGAAIIDTHNDNAFVGHEIADCGDKKQGMQFSTLVDMLTKLQSAYPDAVICFTDEGNGEAAETHFEAFNVDDESDEIEMKFNRAIVEMGKNPTKVTCDKQQGLQIRSLVDMLTKLQSAYPDAIIYFTDEVNGETAETHFETFNIDDESEKIEMKFNTAIAEADMRGRC